MERLNQKGRELKGKAIGFKRFLEVTEKKKIDELIEQNPDYAKEIYPYAFALGVTESYINYLDILADNQNSINNSLNEENIQQINEIFKNLGL